jgi:uncharacterized oxidoreductase
VSSPAEINALFKKVIAEHLKLNVLINNAGIMRQINLHSATSLSDSITQEIAKNLNGPIRIVQAFLEHLKSQPASAIVNVKSGLASVPLPTAAEMMGGNDPKDMEGITIKLCNEMVKASLKSMKADCYEIRPGQANQLKLMNRIAPELILKQLSKPVERMLTHS